jgi:hypothetical protein
MTVEHWVTYLFPGSFFNEEGSVKLTSRDQIEALKKMPRRAFAFSLYDVEVRTGVLEDGEKIVNRRTVNKGNKFYPDGAIYSKQDVAREFGIDSILYANMDCNDWKRLVKTRTGNFQPLEEGDEVVDLKVTA